MSREATFCGEMPDGFSEFLNRLLFFKIVKFIFLKNSSPDCNREGKRNVLITSIIKNLRAAVMQHVNIGYY